MALGFNTTSTYGNRDILPDKGLTRTSTPRVLVARFGDGYEQRIADGINSINETFRVTFNNRTKEEIDDITAYLGSLNGKTAFTYTIPDSNNSGETDIKVVCDTFTQNYSYGDFYSASATFRRVYEA